VELVPSEAGEVVRPLMPGGIPHMFASRGFCSQGGIEAVKFRVNLLDTRCQAGFTLTR
jgi:hypothetical protein